MEKEEVLCFVLGFFSLSTLSLLYNPHYLDQIARFNLKMIKAQNGNFTAGSRCNF